MLTFMGYSRKPQWFVKSADAINKLARQNDHSGTEIFFFLLFFSRFFSPWLSKGKVIRKCHRSLQLQFKCTAPLEGDCSLNCSSLKKQKVQMF